MFSTFNRALIALLLLAEPCFAAININTLGNHHSGSGTSVQLTTITNDCPVNSIPFVFVSTNSATSTLTSVTDSLGNRWVVIDNVSAQGETLASAYAPGNSYDVAIGTVITATISAGIAANISGACITGANTLDIHNVTNNGAAATSSTALSSGTLNFNNEAILGAIAAAGTWSAPTCTGTITGQTNTLVNTPATEVCQIVVAATAAKTMAASWTTSLAYVQLINTFYLAPSTFPAAMTFGVGP